jgi:hypothetical protein
MIRAGKKETLTLPWGMPTKSWSHDALIFFEIYRHAPKGFELPKTAGNVRKTIEDKRRVF